MKNNHDKHKYLIEYKDEIIADYSKYIKVKDIAKKYGSDSNTIRINLRKWGIAKRRSKDEGYMPTPKGKPSPELLAQRQANSVINHSKIRVVRVEDSPEDKRLVHQILQMAIIG